MSVDKRPDFDACACCAHKGGTALESARRMIAGGARYSHVVIFAMHAYDLEYRTAVWWVDAFIEGAQEAINESGDEQ